MKLRLTIFYLLMLISAIPALSSADEPSPKPTDAQLAQAREILKDSPIIDGHNDTPWQYRKRGDDMNAIDLASDTKALKMVTDIPRLRAGCVGGQFWSV